MGGMGVRVINFEVTKRDTLSRGHRQHLCYGTLSSTKRLTTTTTMSYGDSGRLGGDIRFGICYGTLSSTKRLTTTTTNTDNKRNGFVERRGKHL